MRWRDDFPGAASGPLKAKLFGKVPKGTTIGTPFSLALERQIMAVAARQL
jgi:hypothetical protein